MNGLTIFSHSLRQVTGSLGVAIKVSGWLVAIYVIIGGMFYWLRPDWLIALLNQDAKGMENAADFSGGSLGLFFLLVIALSIFLLWAISLVAIAWHRYILLEEIPQGIIPYRMGFHVGRYFWYGLGISLLAVLAVGIVSGILGMIFGPFFMSTMGNAAGAPGGGAFAIGFLSGLIVGIVITVLYLRMALVLPAVALDERLTIGQAWVETSGYTGAIIVLALVLAFINTVVPMVINVAFAELIWLDLALSGLFQWFFFMLNISVLSTLYGHIVQKREVY